MCSYDQIELVHILCFFFWSWAGGVSRGTAALACPALVAPLVGSQHSVA